MAVSGAIIDYTGAAGERNFTVFIQLTFSGSFTTGGDPLNLATLTNPNGLDVEGEVAVAVEMGQCFWYLDAAKARLELGWSPREPGATLFDTVADLRARGVVWPLDAAAAAHG